MNLFITYIFCIGLWVYVAIGQPTNRNTDEWFKEQWPTQPYAFGYEIRDYNGNEQYRKEMSDGDRVTGSYGYMGPDGIFRHVDYTADENGFRAKIRTSEPGTANANPSNVDIESNPVRVVTNPPQAGPSSVTSGVNYENVNPINIAVKPIPPEGLRGDGRRQPDRPIIRDSDRNTFADNAIRNNFGENPNRDAFSDRNRSTYGNRPPPRTSIPRIPDPSRRENLPPINTEIPNIIRGSDVSRPRIPNRNIDNPIIRERDRDRSNFDERPGNQIPPNQIPDNIIPYRGVIPKRPGIDPSRGGPPRGGPPRGGPSRGGPPRGDPPRDGPPRGGPPRDGPPRDGPPRDGSPRDGPPRDGPPRDGPPRGAPPRDEFDDRSIGPNFRGTQDLGPRDRIRPPPSSPLTPPPPPFDQNYGRDDDRSGPRKPNIPSRDSVFDDNRGLTDGNFDDPNRGHDLRKGTPKRPINFGFIEATKGPRNRAESDFFNNKGPPPIFDDDTDEYDEFKRRQDDDRSGISDDPKLHKISPINKPVFEDRDSPQRNVDINRSRYDTSINGRPDGQKSRVPSNRERPLFNKVDDRQDKDTRVRRPKVYVTNGPISMNDDKRYPSNVKKDDSRSYGPDQQHIDVDYEDKQTIDDRFAKDPYEQKFDRPKGPSDRDRPQRPFQREQKPSKGLDPKLEDQKPYLKGREGIQTPTRPQSGQRPQSPSPPFQQPIEQKHTQTSEDDDEPPIQRDDEFPIDQPRRPIKPQVFQPLRPDRPQISQPPQSRTPSSYESDSQQRKPQPKFKQREYRPKTQSEDGSYIEQKHLEIQPFQTQNSASISTPTQTIPTLYKPIPLPITTESSENNVKEKLPNGALPPSAYIVTPFPTAATVTSSKPNLGTHTFPPAITQMQIPKFGARIQTESTPTEEKGQQLINDSENKDSESDKFDDIEEDQYYANYDEDQNQNIEQNEKSKNFSYSQTISHSSNENININTSTSSPTKISHKMLNVINWQKYDHIDDSDW